MYLYSIYERYEDDEQVWYFVSRKRIADWSKAVATAMQKLKNADLYDDETLDESSTPWPDVVPQSNADMFEELAEELCKATGAKLLDLAESASLDIAFIVETYRRSGYDLREEGEITLTEHENDIVIDRIAEIQGAK